VIKLKFNNEIISVTKIEKTDFTNYHHEIIEKITFINGNIEFVDISWKALFLGAGEEKAVYCVCDHNLKIFALELIDEKHYLNGRLADGVYFFSKRVNSLSGKKLNSDSLIGLTFTGLVKAREFIYGYEWGRFYYNPNKKSILDLLITSILQLTLYSNFKEYADRYSDVHERNVMFEIKDRGTKGVFVIAKDYQGDKKIFRVVIRPIDVR